ncbi:lipoprotein releasing system ATPase LolD [Leptospira ryugenii]|uniref:Lipoprotein releasing system ATPase LolD n=1 Tax=Leptospira ryugenii TaxID=1917863 RepID=A0A2P2E1L6_9LEPT|nr:ABC transporter ATP-binding protein [Leptospira ryugenii]GBF50686.1 lipoprotein releasing system ATPase LolD [Leptospira ryugenii]
MSVVLQAESIQKSFGDPPQIILQNISMEILEGEFTALIGKSGSGKSTLLYILSGLDSPSQGKIFIKGKSWSDLSEIEKHEMRNKDLGFVFQFHYLLPELSALENITMPARKSMTLKQATEYAEYLMDEFSLSHCRDKFPNQMSGGEQQRTAIARALIQKPSILFADEPTGNLDTTNGDKVMEIFRKINKEDKTTIVFVTHDPDYAAAAGKRIHLQDGAILKID